MKKKAMSVYDVVQKEATLPCSSTRSYGGEDCYEFVSEMVCLEMSQLVADTNCSRHVVHPYCGNRL